MTTTRTRRFRAAAIATLAVVSAGALSSCSTPEAEGGPITLRVGIQTQDESKPFNAITDAYTELHPEVTFEITEYQVQDYPKAIRTQLQGGNAPDIFYGASGTGYPTSILPFAETGLLVDLSGEPFAENAVPEASRDLFYADEKLWGVPMGVQVIGTLSNGAKMDELGLAQPVTHDEVLEQCATTAAAGTPLFGLAGASPGNASSMTLTIAASTVYAEVPDWNEQRAAGDTTFAETPGWTQALEFVQQLIDADCFQNGVEAANFDTTVPALAAGQVVSEFLPAKVGVSIAELAPDADPRFGFLPGAAADDTRIFVSPNDALVINGASSAAAQAAAKDFFAYWTSPEVDAAYSASIGGISVDQFNNGEIPAFYDGIAEFLRDPQLNQPQANMSWPNGGVTDAIGKGVQGMLTGQATIDDVLAAADAAWDAK